MKTHQPLSSLQLELLKIYSFDPSESELLDVKRLLADYFGDQLVKQVDEQLDKLDISDEDLEKWLYEGA